jgi:hypothetical protein
LLDNFKKYLNNVSDNGVGAFAAMMVSKIRDQDAQPVDECCDIHLRITQWMVLHSYER